MSVIFHFVLCATDLIYMVSLLLYVKYKNHSVAYSPLLRLQTRVHFKRHLFVVSTTEFSRSQMSLV